jgi:hypothetical protein
MKHFVTTTLATTLLAILFASLLAAHAMANTSNSTLTLDKQASNHEKYCEKLKDKKTRSIICPDVYNKKETTINLYG